MENTQRKIWSVCGKHATEDLERLWKTRNVNTQLSNFSMGQVIPNSTILELDIFLDSDAVELKTCNVRFGASVENVGINN